MKKGWYAIILFQIALVIFVVSLINTGSTNISSLRIVSAENFWGSLASQIGGDKVQVSNVVSDPNADPHEFESSSKNSRDISSARLVIVNGLGYDSWANKLIDANPSSNRDVLNVGDFLNLKTGDNPHVWYSIKYSKMVSNQIYNKLSQIDPENSSYYLNNLNNLNKSLNYLSSLEYSISNYYASTDVACTESVFYYMAQEMKLNLISPASFMRSVSEGNEPPSRSVATFIDQINLKQPAILIYNQQTETPITQSMKSLAIKNGIKTLSITETMPNEMNYVQWMNNQINQIYKDLRNE